MKKIYWLCLLVFIVRMPAYAQKIQYSRQTVKMLSPDEVQLVPNINGNHHLLRFFVNKKPLIYIFNNQLQLIAENTIELKLQENMDTRVLSFADHYFFYTHTQNTSTHKLYKVDAEGSVTSCSAKFQQIVDSLLNKSKSTLQLVSQNQKLFVIAHAYYRHLKKIVSTVVELNSNMRVSAVFKASFDFDGGEDQLQQSILHNGSLFVLKTNSTEEQGHFLEIVNSDLATGKSVIKSYHSNSPYSNPGLRVLPKDSTILVQAIVGAGTAQPRQGFITRLNQSLDEVTPFAILPFQFQKGIHGSYFLLNDQSGWINFNRNFFTRNRLESFFVFNQNPTNLVTMYNNHSLANTTSSVPDNAQVLARTGRSSSSNSEKFLSGTDRRRLNSSTTATRKNIESIVRFTVLNNQFKHVQDSVTSFNKNEFGIQALPYAQFSIGNKACLFLIQNFTENKSGLLMMSAEKNDPINTTNINVNYKYEYLLHQMHAANKNSVLLPYTHKNEAGLVRISFE